jgi:starvation-inducible DNA-binding protein
MNKQKAPVQVATGEVARLLQPVLVDLIALSLNGKQAHWHVRGRHFTQIREQLDTLIADVRTFSDDIAERVVALGVAVDGRPEKVAEANGVPAFPDGFIGDDKVISAIVDQIDAVIERVRQTLDPLDEIDAVTQDVVIELLRSLEKHRWMFAAQASS